MYDFWMQKYIFMYDFPNVSNLFFSFILGEKFLCRENIVTSRP